LSSAEVKEIARRVFIMFKGRTDGRNDNLDELAIGNVWGFNFKDKVSVDKVGEAFQLLQLRNLIMPYSGTAGYFRLTTAGKAIDPDDIFEKIVDQAFLHQLSEIMDEELVRGCFDKSYEDAITSAFRILEERIRKRINAGAEFFGIDLVEEAFHAENGKLVFGETTAEKQALYQTYRSSFLMLRNPPSHRYLKEFAGVEIVEIIMFIDFLLKVLSKANDRMVRCRLCALDMSVLSTSCTHCGASYTREEVSKLKGYMPP
jgi:hypothetical protein